MSSKTTTIILYIIFGYTFLVHLLPPVAKAARSFQIQSIDTMKFSRDAARELLDKPQLKDQFKKQVAAIASTGATHIAIGTPYDNEFLPVLKMWVGWAREYNLKIWLRGNWSGWENWFNYSKISAQDHIEKTKNFLRDNKKIFENGDIFTPCPECENGGPGDPRENGRLREFRDFLISHQSMCEEMFKKGPNVICGYHSMNGDVAKLVMDKETTSRLGGFVVVDHYVDSAQKLDEYINQLAQSSGGKIIIGEIGAPIPNIHKQMSAPEQALWMEEVLKSMKNNQHVYGLNYWTSFGGSTALWNSDGSVRDVVKTLSNYFNPADLEIKFIDELGIPISEVQVASARVHELTDMNGVVSIDSAIESLIASHPDYHQKEFLISTLPDNREIELVRKHPSFIFKLQKIFKKLFS